MLSFWVFFIPWGFIAGMGFVTMWFVWDLGFGIWFGERNFLGGFLFFFIFYYCFNFVRVCVSS